MRRDRLSKYASLWVLLATIVGSCWSVGATGGIDPEGVPFVWNDQQQVAFDTLKTCLINAPILGFPTDDGRFILDTDANLFAVGVLNQLQEDREVMIAYASRSLRLSQRRYCTTRREMLAAVVMCTHFRSYLRGAQFTLRTDHSSLWWLQKFCNSDGMLVHVIRPVFHYIRVPSRGSTCECRRHVQAMWTVYEARLSGVVSRFTGR